MSKGFTLVVRSISTEIRAFVALSSVVAAACSPDTAVGPPSTGSMAQAPSAAAAAGPVTTEIFAPVLSPSLGSVFGFATAINEAGIVAGVRFVSGVGANVYLWDNGKLTLYPAGFLPSSINRRREMSGNTDATPWASELPMTVGPSNRAVYWKDGVVTDLGTLGGARSFAADINDKGQIVGGSLLANGQNHAFLWQDGVMTDLGTLGGTTSTAWGINNLGQVVGESTLANGETHAFLWHRGTMIDLGVLGGTFSRATAINDRGEVVGTSDAPAGRLLCDRIPFRWTRGVMTEIPLGTRSCIWPYSVRDISDAGHVVGTAFGSSGSWRAWVYNDGVWLNLPANPGDVAIFRVNSSGEIPGYTLQSVGFGGVYRWSVGRKGPVM